MLDEQTARASWMLFRLWSTGQFDHERRYVRSDSGLRYIQGPFALAECNIPLSIASRASFGSSNFIHLCYSLLEFLVLAFLVAMSFILSPCQRPCHPPPVSNARTSHFHGRYHSSTRHLLSGIRRCAQLSLYGSGNRAFAMACRSAGSEVLEASDHVSLLIEARPR